MHNPCCYCCAGCCGLIETMSMQLLLLGCCYDNEGGAEDRIFKPIGCKYWGEREKQSGWWSCLILDFYLDPLNAHNISRLNHSGIRVCEQIRCFLLLFIAVYRCYSISVQVVTLIFLSFSRFDSECICQMTFVLKLISLSHRDLRVFRVWKRERASNRIRLKGNDSIDLHFPSLFLLDNYV